MAFVETGGRGDDFNYSYDEEYISGAYGMGPTSSSDVWSEYGMPLPTCAERWDVESFVHSDMSCGQGPGAADEAANFPLDQERRGDCDQWRSSCEALFAEYLENAWLTVRVCMLTAEYTPDQQGWVEPCAFSTMLQEALAQIADAVGSDDPVLGIDFPDKTAPWYVPRDGSLIFGGDTYATNWPTFNNPWNPDSPYYQCLDGEAQTDVEASSLAPEEWNVCGYSAYSLGRRRKISNGEFCRGVMEKNYPCSIGASSASAHPGIEDPEYLFQESHISVVPGQAYNDPDTMISSILGSCGGCKVDHWTGECWDDHCYHHPLQWWQWQFSNLRRRVFYASARYEENNQDILKGQSFDDYCAEEAAADFIATPEVKESPYTAEDVQASTEKLRAEQEYQQQLIQGDVLNQMLADMTGEPTGFPTWAKWGGAALGALIVIQVLRG
jgi:hypothetical protein